MKGTYTSFAVSSILSILFTTLLEINANIIRNIPVDNNNEPESLAKIFRNVLKSIILYITDLLINYLPFRTFYIFEKQLESTSISPNLQFFTIIFGSLKPFPIILRNNIFW